MKTFVLVLYFWTGYAGGATTAEFDDKKSCENAIVELKETPRASGKLVIAICVPKNINSDN